LIERSAFAFVIFPQKKGSSHCAGQSLRLDVFTRPDGSGAFGGCDLDSMRVLHASPTWFSPESVIGGGERWVDNVIAALSAGAPEIQQSMVAIGTQSGLKLRGKCLIRILPNERVQQGAMNAISSLLWSEVRNFDLIHVHQCLTDFGAYACCVAASLGKTVVLTDLGGGSSPIMLQGGLAMADGIVSISAYAHSSIAPLVTARNRSHPLLNYAAAGMAGVAAPARAAAMRSRA
jgi:hypothetical protein